MDDNANLYLNLLINEIAKSSRRKLITGNLKGEFERYLAIAADKKIPVPIKLISQASFYSGAFTAIRLYIAAREELLEEGVDARMDEIQEEIVEFFKNIKKHIQKTIEPEILESMPEEAFGRIQ